MIEKKTVGEIARLWKEDKRKYVKYSTFAAYALILEDHILPEFEERTGLGERDVQDVTGNQEYIKIGNEATSKIATIVHQKR